MSRPRTPEPYVQWKIHIPAQLAARVEMLFFDPVHNKPKYGGRAELIKSLLEEWLSRQEKFDRTG